jgi:23S rRNA (uracil1939-C5)-methyltransferase
VLIGFHEKRSSYIADMETCADPAAACFGPAHALRELVGALSIAERMPQIELAVGEHCTALVLRILEPLTAADEKLRAFADHHRVVFYLQPKGPDSVHRLYPPDAPRLSYTLPEFSLELDFRPTDFTQVNHAVNRILVRRALGLLDPQPGERIADMFCGLGNFTLPIARSGASVVGSKAAPAWSSAGGKARRPTVSASVSNSVWPTCSSAPRRRWPSWGISTRC